MRQIKVHVKPKENRIDRYLAKTARPLSRSKAKKFIKAGFVLVNSKSVDPDYELKRGDMIKLDIPIPQVTQIFPENIPLKIVFEDRSILVIDKDVGMVVHPTADHPSGTLVNALLHHLKSIPESGETLRPGIVHRLDKGTSGLLVVAKTQEALDFLKKQFKERRVIKKYLALVRGKIEPPVGTIETTIARHHKNRKKFTVSQEGKDSVTVYGVVDVLKELFSLVEVEPKTGRTHQIRVHLSSIGHPIVGDRLYGGKPAARMFLHASYLEFTHPQWRKKISFASKLPENLEVILQKSRA